MQIYIPSFYKKKIMIKLIIKKNIMQKFSNQITV